MATEIYTPPQELPVTSAIYSLPTDTTGSALYEDPNKVLFAGDINVAGTNPEVTVA